VIFPEIGIKVKHVDVKLMLVLPPSYFSGSPEKSMILGISISS
jgi:hypothetical protein